MEHKPEILNNSEALKPTMAAAMILEIYQYLLRVSSGKIIPLPSITEIARQLGISRQAVYQWINGDIKCPKLAEYIKTVTEISFPVRLKDENVTAARHLFRIRN